MKQSTERILTTHVGSLARSDSLTALLRLREEGKPHDRDELARVVRESVEQVVRKQVEAGVDIVTDGEQGKSGFFTYIIERFNGFERKPMAPGAVRPRAAGREYLSFPDYYAWSERIAEPFGGRSGGRASSADTCTGPVSYRGTEAVQGDIANLKAAVKDLACADVFMPAIASSYIAATFANEYYRTHEEYEQAISDAMREEYKAIVDAGFILQIDDPDLADAWQMHPQMTVADYRKYQETRIAALNHALRDLPSERIRFHMCWGSYHGPHKYDIPLKDIVDLILKVHADAYSIEASNPCHDHEWRVWSDVKFPDGKIFIPGVVGHYSDFIEHPRAIADRLVRYAQIMGRENVIAGTDCGIGSRVGHPQVGWAKFEAMAEGARIATKELWGR